MGVSLGDLFLTPPFAIGRLGGSPNPVESFAWTEDPSRFGGGMTAIAPRISFEVGPDNVPRPYLPSVVHFSDAAGVRPTAPFFELWATVDRDGHSGEEPVTLDLLAELDIELANVSYELALANRKAARRSADPACAYAAWARCNASAFGSTTMLASSTAGPQIEPLVFPECPIPLGSFQVLRPVRAVEMGIDLSVLRVRFLPATGQVYGPPFATSGPDPQTGRIHEMVPPRNRILNPKATWCGTYDQNYAVYDNPEPADTFDGADADQAVDRNNPSFGVVDDTCDGVLTARLQRAGQAFVATARLAVGPPDYGPDRRFFLSLADDLGDRDAGPIEEPTADEVVDLFQRILETLSLQNVDYTRDRALGDNAGNGVTDATPPRTDAGSMTYVDQGYALKSPTYVGETIPSPIPPAAEPPGEPPAGSYSNAARQVHAPLGDPQALIDFLRANAERVRAIVRPRWAAFEELGATPDGTPAGLRDPRRARDQAFDMRMPPYMRDESAFALSITRRQHQMLMDFLARPATDAERQSPAERHLRAVVERLGEAAS